MSAFSAGCWPRSRLPGRIASEMRSAVDRKAEAELALLLAEVPGLPPLARNAVLTLPRLTGGASVLNDAEGICLNTTMMQAFSDLRAVADLLAAYGVDADVSYDLAEVRDLDYYTGITFEGFAPGLGFNLVSGGRYDELIGHFGPPLPAVGWALTLERVLLARELQGVSHAEPRPDVLLAANDCADLFALGDAGAHVRPEGRDRSVGARAGGSLAGRAGAGHSSGGATCRSCRL